MRILLVEPFFSGSHKQWTEAYRHHSSHEVEILSLPGRHWKWRMHGAAPVMADQCRDLDKPELIIASDMLDLAVFKALLPSSWTGIPIFIYFHENQLTYPWSDTDPDIRIRRDRHYAFINFTSALAADRVLFNSEYHRSSFLNALPDFLKAFPDHRPEFGLKMIESKSDVLPLGIDLKDVHIAQKQKKKKEKYVLWNHRWEFDKGPEEFFESLFQFQEEGIDFKLIVCGEKYAEAPAIFEKAKELLNDRIVHWGYAENRDAYIQLLKQSDILPVTSKQDFFGISIAEAVAAGVHPILPRRLSYPILFKELASFYEDRASFLGLFRAMLGQEQIELNEEKVHEFVNTYDWSVMSSRYDDYLVKYSTKAF